MKLLPTPLILLALVLLSAGQAAAGDRIVLKDGQILTGKIIDENASEIRIRVDGAKDPFVLPRSVVAEVKRDRPKDETVAETKKPATGSAVVRLRQGGKQLEGTIVNEDSVSVTLRVGEREYTFDKSRIEWIKQGSETRRFAAPAVEEEAPRDRPRRGGDRAVPTAAFRAWLNLCVKHLGSDDPAVVRSAAGALIGAGPAGRPFIERAAKSDDERVAAMAQRILERGAGGGNSPRGRGNFMQRALGELELTGEQKKATDTIMADYAKATTDMREALRSGEVDREQLRERYLKMNQDVRAKVDAVLDEAQRARLAELLNRRR